ncbi:CGNR zinc finger domain-containing protein [Rhodospirillaceae bacterium SYSU D60014]|uniref:CGNR zinc finger domain-containing protein n=1 Tax=Virgifigura deserti TaxID=2268457 RepID=UPI000E667320
MTVPFPFLGNAAWLDFVNTELSNGDDKIELLTGFDAFMRWGREAKLIDRGEGHVLENAAPERFHPDAVFEEALALRAELRKAVGDLTNGQTPGSPLLDQINKLLGDHPAVLSLKRTEGTWQIGSKPVVTGPRSVLARVAEDFARFMATADPMLLRRCASERCQIYFYDTSKNHTRRWCSMEFCGNRAKVAGHRSRLQRSRP